jgi:ParB family transcriptional regulator, chromosome partitioning protein
VSDLQLVQLQSIRVRNRVRQDMGDLGALMESIRGNGLLNPIAVTSDLTLIAGQRRLEAVKRLGWKEIPCFVIHDDDPETLLQLELDENAARKDFSSDELADALVRLDRLQNPSCMKRFGRWIKRLWERLRRLFSGRRNGEQQPG